MGQWESREGGRGQRGRERERGREGGRSSRSSDGRSSRRLLRGQKFTVVLISPFRSQSERGSCCRGNFDPLGESGCGRRRSPPFPRRAASSALHFPHNSHLFSSFSLSLSSGDLQSLLITPTVYSSCITEDEKTGMGREGRKIRWRGFFFSSRSSAVFPQGAKTARRAK